MSVVNAVRTALLGAVLTATAACTQTVNPTVPTVATSETATPPPSRVVTASPASSSAGIYPHLIRIPNIDVEASVIVLGLEADGTLQIPDASDAGWYEGSFMPGQTGPSVIVGHVDYRGPGVFGRLKELDPGDRIVLVGREGTETVTFAVDRVDRFDKDELPPGEVFGDTSVPTLRLITCGGEFDRSVGHYEDNVVVFASMVEG